jgi:general secretion pathway protein G
MYGNPPYASKCSPVFPCNTRKQNRYSKGFSLIEILVVVGIMAVLGGMAIPKLFSALTVARVGRAVGDLNAVGKDISQYQLQKGTLPLTLADINRNTLLDPWGHPYQYQNFTTGGGPSAGRTDRFGVPINSNYDLYSMGKDGASVASLTAATSQDDVIYGSDGSYMGLASDF